MIKSLVFFPIIQFRFLYCIDRKNEMHRNLLPLSLNKFKLIQYSVPRTKVALYENSLAFMHIVIFKTVCFFCSVSFCCIAPFIRIMNLVFKFKKKLGATFLFCFLLVYKNNFPQTARKFLRLSISGC